VAQAKAQAFGRQGLQGNAAQSVFLHLVPKEYDFIYGRKEKQKNETS
jgi:hypothetical protein